MGSSRWQPNRLGAIRKYGPSAIGALMAAIRQNYKRPTSYIKTKGKKKKRVNNNPISQYHENRLIYKKRSMPKYKKKKWVSFKKKVQYVADTQSKKMVMYHKDAFDISSAADGQGTFDAMMYSAYNATNVTWQDIYRCMQVSQQNNTNTNYASLYFKSARMNLTFYNAGSTPCYMDLYWFYCKKDCDVGALSCWDKSITSAFDQENTAAGVGTNINLSTVFGSTPFQASIAQFVKIYKVTKHYMAANQSIEFVMKDAKNRMLHHTALEQNANSVAAGGVITPLTMKKGWTKGVIGVVYGVPNVATTAIPPTGQYANAATVYCRREVQYVFHPVGSSPGVVVQN